MINTITILVFFMTESYLTYLYLYGAYSKKKVTDLIRNKCIDEESAVMKETLRSWEHATESLRQIETKESGIADNCETFDITSGLIEGVKLNPAIKHSFSKHVLDFKMVEIDKLIAIQRQVLLDYVDKLEKKLPKNPSEDDLIKFCLIPEQQTPHPKHSRKSSNSVYFTSPSADFRFLGGFTKKELTEEDIKNSKVGGFPTHAIMLMVGYGASCMNAYSVNGRVILANGFHRAYVLKKKGIKKIPLLLKVIGNADLEFPDEFQGLKDEYLLKHPRPILVRDFLNDDLVREFKRKQSTTILNVKWDSDKVNIDL